MGKLIVQNLSCEANGVALVTGAGFRLAKGELVTLLGPNGAGKTSLLRAALGLEARSGGSSQLNGQDVRHLSPMQRARQISYLPQVRPLAWPGRVRDIVALGRFAYGAAPGRLSRQDDDAVQRALDQCDLTGLVDRNADTLSGGELARVHFARAFASEAPLMIADEPVAALDPRHQFRVLETVRQYVALGGGALVVLHDISLAARYATRMIWMAEGRIVADGTPEDTLTASRLAMIYGINAKVNGRSIDITGAL